MHDSDSRSPDSDIPAGYAFFAQPVDHDTILDVTSGLRDNARTSDTTPTANDIQTSDNAHTPKIDKVEDLPNLRSVSLDLDSVYGFGREASPHIYDGDHLIAGADGSNPPARPVARP